MIIHNRFLRFTVIFILCVFVSACASSHQADITAQNTLANTQTKIEHTQLPKTQVPPPGLAQCLTDKGTKFYGAFWCKHCIEQKKLFGLDQDKLPYIECSLPDKKGQKRECAQAKITGYPTWEFSDGTRKPGKLDYAYLAEKSGCNN